MIKRYEHFYDKQIYRFLLQVVRAFSGWQYETGARGDIGPQLKMVPCKMAKRNRMVAMIQQNASENVMNTVPQFTVDLVNFRFDPSRLQNPGHVGHVQVYERKIDPVTGQMTAELGNSVTVERLMPRPFTMTCQIDLWTSNLDQKFQLLEQISPVIFPSFDIRNSDNALDWAAITTAKPQDDMTWSSISVPVGNGTDLDIATITLEIPMWINPPAKAKRQQVIEAIITNINEAAEDAEGNLINAARLGQEVTTPGNHCVLFKDGIVTLLGENTNEVDSSGNPFDWAKLFHTYGRALSPAETQLRLRTSTADNAHEIVGTLQPVTNQPNKLFFQPDLDTLPSNTLPAITAVIDPLRSVPGDQLAPATLGQRYLLFENDLPGGVFLSKEGGSGTASTVGWGTVGARVGSIIQFTADGWEVVFDPAITTQSHYLVNSTTSKQLHWTGSDWAVAVEGVYHAGYWRIVD